PPSAPEEMGNESESAGRRIVERSRMWTVARNSRQSEKSEHYGQSKRYTNWAEKNL
ncbi:hypothetical protein M9458_037527, partial [Cirrhinus mrigala]